MDKEALESLLIDYIDGNLNDGDRLRVEKLLVEDEEAKKIHLQLKEVMGALEESPSLEPTAAMKAKFDFMLQAELKLEKTESQKVRYFSPVFYRAAAAIGVIAFLFSYWVYKGQEQERELKSLRAEMDATKKIMMAMLDNQQSASSRMRGATVAYQMDKPDDQIVSALVRTMNEDPNTNVRLAALEALGKFHQQPSVRKALIASLSTQKDPLVQIALIQLMVQMKEKSTVKEMEKMVNDIQTIKAVKDEAYSGIMKLS